MGLGPYPDVTLEEAREEASKSRKKRRAGINPIAERDAENSRKRGTITFQECADQYIASHRAAWKNAKHAEQWTSTIANYCGPVMGKLPVNEIDVALVMRVLSPIWTTKAETRRPFAWAHRVNTRLGNSMRLSGGQQSGPMEGST